MFGHLVTLQMSRIMTRNKVIQVKFGSVPGQVVQTISIFLTQGRRQSKMSILETNVDKNR